MPLTTVSPGMLDTTAQYYGFKSRIINGNMAIDQRNAGASYTITGDAQYGSVDRFMARIYGGPVDFQCNRFPMLQQDL